MARPAPPLASVEALGCYADHDPHAASLGPEHVGPRLLRYGMPGCSGAWGCGDGPNSAQGCPPWPPTLERCAGAKVTPEYCAAMCQAWGSDLIYAVRPRHSLSLPCPGAPRGLSAADAADLRVGWGRPARRGRSAGATAR